MQKATISPAHLAIVGTYRLEKAKSGLRRMEIFSAARRSEFDMRSLDFQWKMDKLADEQFGLDLQVWQAWFNISRWVPDEADPRRGSGAN